MNVKFIEYNVCCGEENMKIDAALLEESIKTNFQFPIMRLYGWKPACISLGRNQNGTFLDKNLLKSQNIDIVKRLTGGRALLHDNELTYCYVTPVKLIKNGENVLESYKYISQIWIDIFNSLGIKLNIGGLKRHITGKNYCMSISTGADLCFNDKKFIGSAQCRKMGYIMQHGSILLDYDKNLLNKVFNETTDFSSIISLKEINKNLSEEDIIKATKQYLNNL